MRPGASRISTVFFLLLLLARAVLAQPTTGGLHGKAILEDGEPLPGVTIILGKLGSAGVQVTDDKGEFHFIGVFPGEYPLTATYLGYEGKSNVVVSPSRISTIKLTLHLCSLCESFVGLSIQPIRLEGHNIEARTTRTETDLEHYPSARDAWAILQQTAGVLADRINVGGNESGHASMYVEPGSSNGASTYLVDGVSITDFTSPGSLPTYYDFAFVDGVDVTTGGADPSVATGGPVVQIFTKRGTNAFRGGGSYRFDPAPKSSLRQEDGAYPLDSRATKLHDYSATLGGPLVKDKLWFFGGSSGQQGTWNFGAADGRFDSPGSFNSAMLTMNALPARSDRFNVFFLDSHRSLLGPASDLGMAISSLLNSAAPLKTFSVEDHHIFTSNVFLTGTYSLVRSGVDLTPASGDTAAIYGTNNVWRNGFILNNSDRPQHAFGVDGTSFFSLGSLNHELRFGASSRKADVADVTRWPQGFGYLEDANGSLARFFVGNSDTRRSNHFTDLYLQQGLLLRNLTTTVGARFEHATGTDGPNTRSGNPWVSLVQAVTQSARQTVSETHFDPRIGFSWSPSFDQRLAFSGGYDVYVDKLALPVTAFSTEVRGNSTVDGAIVVNDANLLLGRFDPIKNLIDPHFQSTRMSELFGGLEVALGGNVIVGARYTARRLDNLPVLRDLVLDGTTPRVATTNDTFLFGHLAGADPLGRTVSIPVFDWKLGVTPYPNGQLLTNSAAETEYNGASLTFDKRFVNRWMLRGNATFNDWNWNVPATETVNRPFGVTVGAGQDGEAVAPHSTAPDAVGVYMNSKFSYDFSGLYQFGGVRGIDASFNVYGRQGYPMPFYAAGGGRTLQSGRMDDHRYPSVAVLDVGARKTIRVDRVSASIGIDCFNVAGAKTPTQVKLNLLEAGAGDVLQTVSPRVARVGIRVEF